MTIDETVTFAAWPNLRLRIVALEHSLYTWNEIIASHKGEMEPAKERHAQYEMQTAKAELIELRSVLAFWEENRQNTRKEISLRAAVSLAVGYAVILAIIIIYLAAMAGK